MRTLDFRNEHLATRHLPRTAKLNGGDEAGGIEAVQFALTSHGIVAAERAG